MKERKERHRRMTVKKKLILKLGIVLSLMAINAFAATPGSNCVIRARVLGVINATITGKVESSGNACVPTALLAPVLSPLQTGKTCGQSSTLGLIIYNVSCPN